MADDGNKDSSDASTKMVALAPHSVAPAKYSHLLEVTAGAPPMRFALNAAEGVLGRGADVDYRIDSEELSRRHARFRLRGGDYVCHDLDSRNGIFLNGLRIHSAVLRDGDVLQLGTIVIIYRERY